MAEVEILIQANGTCLVPRGTSLQNEMICNLLSGLTELEDLHNFFAITDDSEVIFGEPGLCG